MAQSDYGQSLRPAPGGCFAGVVGLGVERSLTSRLALRVDGQAITFLIVPMGTRMAAGLPIAVGRLR
jgi:hypothetical protein